MGLNLIFFSFLFLLSVSGYLTSSSCAFWDWYRHLGRGPTEVLTSLVFHPGRTLSLLVYPLEKMKTVFWLLFSFGFLPLLSPGFLLISLPMFAERFLSNRPELWSLGLHYNILTVPVFTWAAIRGIKRLKKQLRINSNLFAISVSLYLAVCLLAATLFKGTPLTKLFNSKFYQLPSYLESTRKMIDKIPQYATLEAQEDLFPHLSHRDKIYALGEGGAVEFIALDVNLFAAQEGGKDKYIDKLLKEQDYGLIFCEEGSILFERGKKDQVDLCPKVKEFVERVDGV